jgi:hypothetical protein
MTTFVPNGNQSPTPPTTTSRGKPATGETEEQHQPTPPPTTWKRPRDEFVVDL